MKPMLLPRAGRRQHEIPPYAGTLRDEAAYHNGLVIRLYDPFRAVYGEVANCRAVDVVRLSGKRLELLAFIHRHVDAHLDEIEQERVGVGLYHPVAPPPDSSIR